MVFGMSVDILPQHTDKIAVRTTVMDGEMLMGLAVHCEDQCLETYTVDPTLEVLS